MNDQVDKDTLIPAEDGKLAFTELLMGFSSAALYYIGHSEVEGKKPPKPNMPLARQHIDIILMLKDKTKGNLDREEEDLMSEILDDLETKYRNASP